MARNALEAVFGALGGGLVGYGKDKNLRMDREEERLARELAARQSAEQRRISLFQSGLEDAAPLRERAANMGTASSAVQAMAKMPPGGRTDPVAGMPVGMSAVANALSSASSGMQSDLGRGRSLTVDGRDYVQPFSRSPEGRAERDARQKQSEARVEAMNLKERDILRGEQQMAVVRQQGRNALDVANARNTPTVGGDPSGRGPLPTVVNAISDLRALTPADIRGLRSGTVQTVQEMPTRVAESKGMLEYGLARGVQGFSNMSATDAEQKYALQARAVSDAVARANERGVLSNQDNDRYIRQVSLQGGDNPTVKTLKVNNLISWAEWLTGANQMLANGATPEQVRASATATADQIDLSDWTERNPFDETKETPDQYRAKARAAIQRGGR